MPKIVGEKLILDQQGFNSNPSFQEQTRPQVAITSGSAGLGGGIFGGGTNFDTGNGTQNGIVTLGQKWRDANQMHFAKVRTMRRHPTVKIVRLLSCACMALAKWSVETKNDCVDGATEVVQDVVDMQSHIQATALPGVFDFGWQAYEKVLQFDLECGRTKLRKLKPLLQDQTRIMVDRNTGSYAGVQNLNKFLSITNSLLINQNVEGTYFYGESDMAAIETAYDRWIVTDRSNVKYDQKVSGAHWVVHYPEGVSELNGVTLDNYLVAKQFLQQLEGSGSIAVPSTVLNTMTDITDADNDEAWRIELVAAPSAQGEFSTRMSYLDALMVRAGGFPERAILEGQYGTKAEAGEHADFAIALLDMKNRHIIDLINWHLVNPMLRLNLGMSSENKAFITVAPIADDKRDLLKQIYMAALANPGIGSTLYQQMDMKAIREQLQIPSNDHSGSDESLNNMLQVLQQNDQMTDPTQPQYDSNQQPTQQAV